MTSKIGDFTVLKKLGDGAYSSVYKVKRLDDQDVYALKKVKLLSLTEKEKENALNEVRILASIDHPNVIGFKDAFIDESSSSLCLVMEHADNGDVFQKICSYQKRETYIKEKKIWYVFIQIVRGLRAFHLRKIMHRDMKSANIFLFKDMQAKLGDLNVSKIVKKGLSYTQTGTPYYASPEVWKDLPYDYKSDIWSLGCVLYEMCALVPPFRADDMQGLYKMVVKAKYPRIPDHFSQEMATVIKFMLQTAPANRPTCDQILALPIVESLSKRFFAEERNKLEEIEENATHLIKTIRMSKNLFSLTERLPKNKYRQRSGELRREISQDSIVITNVLNSITPQAQNNFKLADASRIRSGGSAADNEGDENQYDIEKLRQIAKPSKRSGRNNSDVHQTVPLTSLKQRHLSVNDTPKQLRPLINHTPSHAQIIQQDFLAVDEDEEQDDKSPEKPIISPDANDYIVEHDVLPMLAQRHRSVAPQKKAQINHIPVYGLENESQNSNSLLQLGDSPLKLQKSSVPQNQIVYRAQSALRETKGTLSLHIDSKKQKMPAGHQQRMILKVRENRVLNNNQKFQLNPVKIINNAIQQSNANRNRSHNNRENFVQENSLNRVIHRNGSKVQLQLPEIGGARAIQPPMILDMNEMRQQRLVSAHQPSSIMIGKQAQQHMVSSPTNVSKDLSRVAGIKRGEVSLGSSPSQLQLNVKQNEEYQYQSKQEIIKNHVKRGGVMAKKVNSEFMLNNSRITYEQTGEYLLEQD